MKENSIIHMFVGTGPQLLASLTGTISAISDGMQYGWTAPVVPILEKSDSPVKISNDDDAWLENLYMIGGFAGLPITIYLVDKIGRKKSVLFAALCSLIGWILIGVANRVEYLFVARFFTGIAADVAFVAAPMYVAEIADQKIRGFLAGIIYLMMLLGVLLIYSIAPFVPFYVPSIVGGLILITQLITFSLMPESPYYLLEIGKKDEAKKSLDWLRGTTETDLELEEISAAIERQQQEKGRPQDLILVESNRIAFIIIAVLNGAQHFCGITVMFMNIHKILTDAGSTYIDENSAGIIFSALTLISATISSFYVDKYGRKSLLFISCILTGLSLLCLAIYGHLKHSGTDMDELSWIPVVSVMVYAIVFKFGLGMVPIVLTAEVFAAKVKAIGMTLGDTMYIIFGLLSLYLYQWLADTEGIYVSMYIFGIISFLTAIFSITYIPETKGKTLEEIQMKFKQRTSKNHELPGEQVEKV